MGNQRKEDKTSEKFTWTIEHFSKLDSVIYSETFFLSGHPWQIIIFPKGDGLDYLEIYLDAGDVADLPKYAKFKLPLINQFNGDRTIADEGECEFNARDPNWGFNNFIDLDELHNSSNGFLVNDICIIEAEITYVRKSEHGTQVDSVCKNDISPVSAPLVCDEPIEHTGNPLPNEISMTSFGDDLVDFRGLGKIQKDFVPLLDEVCSLYPSLVDCQRNRNRTDRYTEWAFTALGRVLHFLKTKKVKDMNDEACNHLHILWEELKTFGFDLTWLEPHLQSALGMKSYSERAAQVKKLKENVDALEVELKRARSNLVEAEEGFVERDLDAEVGYRGP